MKEEENGATGAFDAAHDEVEDLENGALVLEDQGDREDYTETKGNGRNLSHRRRKKLANRPGLIAALIILLGTAAFGIILGFGITAAKQDQENYFESLARDLLHDFEEALGSFVMAGLWLHQACRSRSITHQEFREAFEYLQSTGLEFRNIAFAMNVTSDAERAALENQTQAYIKETQPGASYPGFRTVQRDHPNGPTIVPQSNQSHYFPVHYVEPIEQFHPVIDVDFISTPGRRKALEEAIETWQPAMTVRLKLTGNNVITTDPDTYSVILVHPGIPLPSRPEVVPRDVSVLAIDINNVMTRAHRFLVEKSVSVYLFDSTDPNETPPFLGGATLPNDKGGTGNANELKFLPEIELSSLVGRAKYYTLTKNISAASRKWTFVAVASEDDYRPEVTFVILVSLQSLEPNNRNTMRRTLIFCVLIVGSNHDLCRLPLFSSLGIYTFQASSEDK